VFVEPLGDVIFGPVRPALFTLLAAVGVMLVIACVNIASLLLARGASRVREVGVSAALGASRWRVARQFLIEGLLLTLVAAAAGVLLAVVGLRVLVAMAPPDTPRLAEITIDLPVLAATLGVSFVVGLVFGMVPTLQAWHLDLQGALKGAGDSRSSSGRAHGRAQGGLVVAEVGLAVVLLAAGGLLLRSFWNLQAVDPGFRAGGLLKAEYQLPAARYPADFKRWPDFKEMHAFTEGVQRRVSALPGVESVAVAGEHPLDPGFTNSFVVVGREAEAENWPEIAVRRVTSGYFRTVGLALVRGRLIDDRDATRAAPVLLVSEAAARRFFEGRDPLGAQIRLWGAARTVVGVVADQRFRGVGAPAPMAVYAPLAQTPSVSGAGVLLVRTSGDPSAMSAAVRGAIRDQDPGLAVFGVEPLDRTLARSMSRPRFTVILLGSFAALAVLLAAIGVHGLLAWGVARRHREFGVRIALGASAGSVRRSVIREGLGLTLLGLAFGIPAAVAVSRALRSLLFGIGPTDPLTYAVVAITFLTVAIVASGAPARRATMVDPILALRSE
jgi:putative ABC transport system permease protein